MPSLRRRGPSAPIALCLALSLSPALAAAGPPVEAPAEPSAGCTPAPGVTCHPHWQLRAEYRLLGIGLSSLPVDELGTRFGQKAWTEQRLSVLEFVVRKNSDDIRKNSDAIVALQQEVHRMADILGADRDENAIASLERRVKALEDRVS